MLQEETPGESDYDLGSLKEEVRYNYLQQTTKANSPIWEVTVASEDEIRLTTS